MDKVDMLQTELWNFPLKLVLPSVFPILVSARTILPVPQGKNVEVKTHIQSLKNPADAIFKMYIESNHFYHLQTQTAVIFWVIIIT